MTSVCMSGQSSVIQKTALLGSEANRKVTVYGKRDVISTDGLGLLDLLKIKFPVGEGMSNSHLVVLDKGERLLIWWNLCDLVGVL